MKKLCNIVRERKGRIDVQIPFNDVGSIAEIDKSLPTLVIGYELAKKCIKGFKILKKDYPLQNLSWCLSDRENYSSYEKDITNFFDKIINSTLSEYHYENIDVLTLTGERYSKIQSYCKGDDKKIIFSLPNQLFFLSETYHVVWGVSLDNIRFMGWDVKSFLPFDYNNPNNIKLNDLSSIPYRLKEKMDYNIWKIMVLYTLFH